MRRQNWDDKHASLASSVTALANATLKFFLFIVYLTTLFTVGYKDGYIQGVPVNL